MTPSQFETWRKIEVFVIGLYLCHFYFSYVFNKLPASINCLVRTIALVKHLFASKHLGRLMRHFRHTYEQIYWNWVLIHKCA